MSHKILQIIKCHTINPHRSRVKHSIFSDVDDRDADCGGGELAAGCPIPDPHIDGEAHLGHILLQCYISSHWVHPANEHLQ